MLALVSAITVGGCMTTRLFGARSIDVCTYVVLGVHAA